MYNIILNPVSGKGKSLKAYETVKAVLTERGIPFELHTTEFPGHASEIAGRLSQSPETKIIAMGGDGTFNEILNGIENFENVTLGIIACGTGNDYIKAAKLPKDPVEALDIILKGNTGYTDFIQLDTRRALNCAGAGMDVDVLVRYSTMKAFKGKMKYYASLIDTLLHLQFHKLRLTIDGKTEEKSVFLITVANGTCIGGGMPVSPNSDPYDGVMNVVVVNEMKKRKIPMALLAFLKGKHISKPYTEEYLCKEVTIEILDDGKTEVDGEVFDNKILNCKLISNTLKIYK